MKNQYEKKVYGKVDEIWGNIPNPRYPKFDIKKAVTLDKWRSAIAEHFPDLVFPAEVGLSVIAQLLINDIKNPFGLVYIDVPSAGKTITLNFFSEMKEITYYTDNFSAAAFVSQAANVKKEKLGDVDLLPRIQNKTLIVRDLAPIFGSGDENLLKTMGILTRVFDGEGLWLDGGVHGRRGYEGEYLFMFLGGSTPIAPRVWKFMGNFGSRLLFVGINSKEKNEDMLAAQLTNTTIRNKEKQCKKATTSFLKTLWAQFPDGINWQSIHEPKEAMRIIARTAKLLARLRGTVNVWKDNTIDESYEHTIPIKEMPDRINQLLYNLTRGHAVVRGEKNINMEDISVILRVALDSAPLTRIKLFKALLDNRGILTTENVMKQLKCSRPTALKEMEVLNVLELVELEGDGSGEPGRPEKVMCLKDDLSWFISDECYRLRGVEIPQDTPEPANITDDEIKPEELPF
jgi:hypothetical protein